MPDLITLARAQQAPFLASANTTLLASLISAASEAIANFLQRSVIQIQATETYDGDGSRELQLDEPDVVSLDTVDFRDGSGVWNSVLTTDFYTHLKRGEMWFIEQPAGSYVYFPRGRQNVRVKYTRGLAAAVGSVPASIAQATVETVVRMLSSSTTDPTEVMERLGDYTQQRNAAAQMVEGLPKTIKDALGHYRNRVL